MYLQSVLISEQIRMIVECLQISHLNIIMQGKNLKMVGEKFLKDTAEYRSIPKSKRMEQIRSSMSTPKSEKEFDKVFPDYPIQYTWRQLNKNLAAYSWEPQKKPRALLINYHALNSHTGLSGEMAKLLSKQGIVTAGFDFPNFGKSESPHPGHIEQMEELIQLSQQFLLHSMTKYSGLPVFVSGLSMGGLIAYHVGLRRPSLINGCIFMNPALKDNPFNNNALKKLMMLMGFAFPKLQTIKPLRSMSTKHSLEDYKKRDNLMYSGKVWTSTTWALLSSMHQACKTFDKFDLPYLCIQGGTDKVLNPYTVFKLEEQSKTQDKETVIIHDLWHGLWFDDFHHDSIKMTKQWIIQRV